MKVCHVTTAIGTLTVLALLVVLPAPVAGESVVVDGPQVTVPGNSTGSSLAQCPAEFQYTKGGYHLRPTHVNAVISIKILFDGPFENGHRTTVLNRTPLLIFNAWAQCAR